MSARIPARQTVMIGFTSGSTGQPKAYPKLWSSVHGSTARNAAAIRRRCESRTQIRLARSRDRRDGSAAAHVWDGAEHSVAAHRRHGRARRPTAVSRGHRARARRAAGAARAGEHAGALANARRVRAAVSRHGADRLCDRAARSGAGRGGRSAARRAVARDVRLDRDVRVRPPADRARGGVASCTTASQLQPRADGTLVHAPWFVEPVLLQDIVELLGDGQFVVRGRNTDMIEVAGKRASLADLTRRLLAIEGVRDAVRVSAASRMRSRRFAESLRWWSRRDCTRAGRSCERLRRQRRPGIPAAPVAASWIRCRAMSSGKLPREKLLELLNAGDGRSAPAHANACAAQASARLYALDFQQQLAPADIAPRGRSAVAARIRCAQPLGDHRYAAPRSRT